MKREDFNEVVQQQMEKVLDVLCVKAEEYCAGKDDRLHNFTKGARFRRKPKEEVLWGMVLKHFIALDDFVSALSTDRGDSIPEAQWDEKITDIQVYLMVLLAIRAEAKENARRLYERRGK
jgi:hypothetical protein